MGRLGQGLLATTVAALWLVTRWQTIQALQKLSPAIALFEQEWELERWNVKEGTTVALDPQARSQGEHGLAIHCSVARYPGVSVEDFEADWRGYRALAWDAAVTGDRPLMLNVRIDDDQGEEYGTRYTAIVELRPGHGTYRIPLADIASHFADHPMNLAQITELHFFLDHPSEPATFGLDHVRLER